MSSSTGLMDWDTQYDAGLFDKPATSSTRVGTSSKSRQKSSALFTDDDDNLSSDVTMAGPSVPSRSSTLVPTLEEEIEDSPLQRLTRHWMNERHAPDILPAQEELLSSLLDHIRRQSDAVQLLRGDPSTSEEEYIRIMLVQMEVERVKFIVRSYVRTRLFKIEKYARFITTNPEVQTRITTAERAHASRFAHLTDRHFHFSVLQSLPETQSHLDDTPIFMPPMITKPDESRPVFVHALRDCPPIRFHDDLTLEMQRGHISLMPFSFAEQLLTRGDVELI